MSIEHLRDLALNELAPTADYAICLDRDLRQQMVILMGQINAATTKAQKIAAGQIPAGSMTDEDPASKAERLTGELEALYEQAKSDSIVVIFRRLPATRDVAEEGETAYSTIARRHTTKGGVDLDAVADDLMPESYLRAESADGEDVGLTWLQVKRTFDQGDLKQIRAMLIGLHHTGAAVPFDPRTFGQPETT